MKMMHLLEIVVRSGLVIEAPVESRSPFNKLRANEEGDRYEFPERGTEPFWLSGELEYNKK